MDKPFSIGVKAVIIKEEKILLLKRQDLLGNFYWDLPGGRIKIGETYI